MVGWCVGKTGLLYDDRGQCARGGKVLDRLLALMLQEPYLQLPHPKRTVRELFHMHWLLSCIAGSACQHAAEVAVMRTLLEQTICDAVPIRLPAVAR